DTYGYALVDYDPSVSSGRYLYWKPDGSTKELAKGVIDSGLLVTDYNPTAGVGRFAFATQDQLTYVANRVPSYNFEYTDTKGRWSAVFHEFDGKGGTLSIAEGVLGPGYTPPLEAIADDVGFQQISFLDGVLPGVGYLRHFDSTTGTGRL